jgi:hypothetical protein
MKMAKASERDIEAAGDAMSVLNDISSGYYPARNGEEDTPTWFDPDEVDHLRVFYNLIAATLDAAPGWQGRVIGGMCYVILYDKNEIVDPKGDVLELHPRLRAAVAVAVAAKRLEERGFFSPTSCANAETSEDMAEMRNALAELDKAVAPWTEGEASNG